MNAHQAMNINVGESYDKVTSNVAIQLKLKLLVLDKPQYNDDEN